MTCPLVDADGENQAVRQFLIYYGGNPSVSIGGMRDMLERSGFAGCAPEWALTAHPKEHLAKAGAQLWIRHLFALENAGSTPAAHWRAKGEPDPHAGHYDGERAGLTLGQLTDDELANAAFMHYDRRPPISEVLAGRAFMPIAYMTAVKERIRWLSRALAKATADRPSGVNDDK
jgi:hypothetical protein